jgi:hypothetical protein
MKASDRASHAKVRLLVTVANETEDSSESEAASDPVLVQDHQGTGKDAAPPTASPARSPHHSFESEGAALAGLQEQLVYRMNLRYAG